MARLSDLPEGMAEHLLKLPLPEFDDTALVAGSALAERRVAIVTSAGLARRGGRTTVGLSGLAPDAIVEFLAVYAERGEETSPHPHRDGVNFSRFLKHALDDLLAWYQEAVTAQPGSTPSGRELVAWFWGETRASRLFLAVRERGVASEDPGVRLVVKALLVPRGASAWLQPT